MVHINTAMLKLTSETKQIETINNHQRKSTKPILSLLKGLIINGNGKFRITYINILVENL